MAVFGFIVLTSIVSFLTTATIFLLLYGGFEMGTAKLPVWLITVPLVIIAWWQLSDMAPFSIALIGGAG